VFNCYHIGYKNLVGMAVRESSVEDPEPVDP